MFKRKIISLVQKAIGYGNYMRIHVFFKYKKPTTLRLDIAATCNAQCPFCPRVYMEEGRLVGTMDFETVKETLIDAKNLV